MQNRSKRREKHSTGLMGAQFLTAALSEDFPFNAAIECLYTTTGYDSAMAAPHFHDALEIAYCHAGKGFFQIADKALDYRPGDIVVITPNEPHIAYYASPSTWTWISCDPVKLLAQEPGSAAMSDISRFSGAEFVNLLPGKKHPLLARSMQILIEEARAANAYHREAIRALVGYVLAYLHRVCEGRGDRPAGSGVNRIRPAIDHIQFNFSEKISVELLAGLCAMSEQNFRRVFHAIAGKSPHDYLAGFRISIAARMLRSTDDKIETIASQCGYEDPSAFRRAFRAVTGTTPVQWRGGDQ